MIYSTWYQSLVGPLALASDGENLIGLWLRGQKYFGGTVTEEMREKPDLPVFAATREWLDRYFNGGKPSVTDLPLAPGGSEFRKAVWDILCGIPYGTYVTYGEIAKTVAARMNRPGMSGQAVGGAVGHNPISIVIPCHRVVGAGGKLTGYAGGIDRKIALLKHEGVDISSLAVASASSCATLQ